ncbi:MAG: hypothetical protein JO364_16330 [Pseudonocardiales bacterium]|nr:hypothetical protein [Pseudonocardiales bacterium]
MNLDDLLQAMDRAAANLAKLDALWERACPNDPDRAEPGIASGVRRSPQIMEFATPRSSSHRRLASLSSNGERDTGLDLGRGLVSWPAHRAASGLPLLARCEPSRGSQVKAGVALTTRDHPSRFATWNEVTGLITAS